MLCFNLLAGTRVTACCAIASLRTRANRSAMGSVIIVRPSSPTGLGHARQFALEGQLAQADAAKLEVLVERPRPTTDVAAVVHPRRKLGRPTQFGPLRSSRHFH